MEFIDLKTQHDQIKDSVRARIDAVIRHGNFIMGPEVSELEVNLRSFVGCKHCICCASGTDALLMVLMAHGVGPGDAVFTTPFTFIATAEVIALLGATPVFVDIDPITYNIDPSKLEAAISDLKKGTKPSPGSPDGLRPRGIIPVDLFGLLADYDAINLIADTWGLFVLEDAAQSFGGEYKGRKSCNLAHAAATSFFPAKPLG
jgi:UDP-2-acetamido-2-deoxy-ribo-hexuluronate aminotransferase